LWSNVSLQIISREGKDPAEFRDRVAGKVEAAVKKEALKAREQQQHTQGLRLVQAGAARVCADGGNGTIGILALDNGGNCDEVDNIFGAAEWGNAGLGDGEDGDDGTDVAEREVSPTRSGFLDLGAASKEGWCTQAGNMQKCVQGEAGKGSISGAVNSEDKGETLCAPSPQKKRKIAADAEPHSPSEPLHTSLNTLQAAAPGVMPNLPTIKCHVEQAVCSSQQQQSTAGHQAEHEAGTKNEGTVTGVWGPVTPSAAGEGPVLGDVAAGAAVQQPGPMGPAAPAAPGGGAGMDSDQLLVLFEQQLIECVAEAEYRKCILMGGIGILRGVIEMDAPVLRSLAINSSIAAAAEVVAALGYARGAAGGGGGTVSEVAAEDASLAVQAGTRQEADAATAGQPDGPR
jgi:hypothetical protein